MGKAMERLHPVDEIQVIREVIPGGDEPRTLKLYPNHASVRVVQLLENRWFIPGFVVTLVDDGRPVPASFLHGEDYGGQDGQVGDEEFTHAA